MCRQKQLNDDVFHNSVSPHRARPELCYIVQGKASTQGHLVRFDRKQPLPDEIHTVVSEINNANT